MVAVKCWHQLTNLQVVIAQKYDIKVFFVCDMQIILHSSRGTALLLCLLHLQNIIARLSFTPVPNSNNNITFLPLTWSAVIVTYIQLFFVCCQMLCVCVKTMTADYIE